LLSGWKGDKKKKTCLTTSNEWEKNVTKKSTQQKKKKKRRMYPINENPRGKKGRREGGEGGRSLWEGSEEGGKGREKKNTENLMYNMST